MLKKLCLIVMVNLLFIGCSKSDSSNSVNPPEWILGTWINVLEENKEIVTFTTSDGYLGTEKESSLFESSFPKTPGIILAIASIKTHAATSPPLKI